MTVIWTLVAVLLSGATLLSLTRLLLGPSILDRAIAVDVLLACAIAGIGAYAAAHRDPTVLPILLVLALLGFVGSVSIARFVARRTKDPFEPVRGPESGGREGDRT